MGRKKPTRRTLSLRTILIAVILLLIIAALVFSRWPGRGRALANPIEPVSLLTWDGAQDTFDVIVTGSEPEGVIAAVAAAEEGASVLLITEDPQIGGLFVMGQMNSLDLRTQPHLYQRGLFERWWDMVVRRSAFDIVRAEHAFETMLADAGVTVLKNAEHIRPRLEGHRIVGVASDQGIFTAGQVIDATSEADVAAAAGAPYTIGFESVGLNSRMVDTLVFRIDGVDWNALTSGIGRRGGRSYAEVNPWAAWGHFGGYPAQYQAEEPGIRLRGLNLGRQEDDTVLVNALMIGSIDPFDPESRAEGKARAEREAPRIIAYLHQDVPGFDNARYGGVAEQLYIRETRHLEALCMLTIDDVMDNRVTEQDIAAGGYPLDVHPLSPHDSGFVFGVPDIYGARLCVSVPQEVDNLWVVGKAAGYDPLAHSSARVVPFGMAVAEAVGVAAVKVLEQGTTPASFAQDDTRVQELRARLSERGAYLPEVRARNPVGPHQHPHYDAYRTMLRRGLALGGYDNNPQLDQDVTAISYVYLLSNVGQRFLQTRELGIDLVARFEGVNSPLTPELALEITTQAACYLGDCPESDWGALQANALAPEGFAPSGTLTRGEAYALAAKLARLGEN